MIDFKRLDHILITIPPHCKDEARKFYVELLGLKEIPGNHPNGAMWFEIANIQLHIREEKAYQFDSARHPAFEVSDLLAAKQFLEQKDIQLSYSSVIEARERCFFRDPFGNRFELIEFKNQ